MKITSRGRVAIPKAIRDKAGIQPGDSVEFHFEGDSVRISKTRVASHLPRGAALIESLKGKGDIALSTDEIMAMTRGEELD